MLLVINILCTVQLQFVSITRLLYSFTSPHDHDHVTTQQYKKVTKVDLMRKMQEPVQNAWS